MAKIERKPPNIPAADRQKRSAPSPYAEGKQEGDTLDIGDTKVKKQKRHDDPTRFGDWENKGRCIDF